jgi:hypothetical protein
VSLGGCGCGGAVRGWQGDRHPDRDGVQPGRYTANKHGQKREQKYSSMKTHGATPSASKKSLSTNSRAFAAIKCTRCRFSSSTSFACLRKADSSSARGAREEGFVMCGEEGMGMAGKREGLHAATARARARVEPRTSALLLRAPRRRLQRVRLPAVRGGGFAPGGALRRKRRAQALAVLCCAREARGVAAAAAALARARLCHRRRRLPFRGLHRRARLRLPRLRARSHLFRLCHRRLRGRRGALQARALLRGARSGAVYLQQLRRGRLRGGGRGRRVRARQPQRRAQQPHLHLQRQPLVHVVGALHRAARRGGRHGPRAARGAAARRGRRRRRRRRRRGRGSGRGRRRGEKRGRRDAAARRAGLFGRRCGPRGAGHASSR